MEAILESRWYQCALQRGRGDLRKVTVQITHQRQNSQSAASQHHYMGYAACRNLAQHLTYTPFSKLSRCQIQLSYTVAI